MIATMIKIIVQSVPSIYYGCIKWFKYMYHYVANYENILNCTNKSICLKIYKTYGFYELFCISYTYNSCRDSLISYF